MKAFDVLSLGSCSKSLNRLCSSDSVWKNLYVKRWPADHSEEQRESSSSSWKDSYISKEKAIASALSDYCRTWSAKEMLGTPYLEGAMSYLVHLKLGVEDACLLFRRKHGVLVNILGLHYAFVFLGVSTDDLTDALARYQISHRRVNVCWNVDDNFSCGSYTTLHYSLTLSLNEIASTEQAIFYLLHEHHDHVRSLRIIPHSLCK